MQVNVGVDALIAGVAMTLKGRFMLEDAAPGVDVTRWGSVNYCSLIAFLRDGEGWAGCADLRRNAAVYGY